MPPPGGRTGRRRAGHSGGPVGEIPGRIRTWKIL
nr:MAG TPA: hypothetical protein [Caudoviricetes sp.]